MELFWFFQSCQLKYIMFNNLLKYLEMAEKPNFKQSIDYAAYQLGKNHEIAFYIDI